eukprot:m.253708 g.253708  ORF g.253708 m.253708 type:complete len:71 (-) comp26525_c0_seq4:3585-3797(-)
MRSSHACSLDTAHMFVSNVEWRFLTELSRGHPSSFDTTLDLHIETGDSNNRKASGIDARRPGGLMQGVAP